MFAPSLLAVLIPLSSLLGATQGYNVGADDTLLERSPLEEPQGPATNRGSWLGWGANVYNNRLAASDTIVDASNVASLDSICKEIYPIGESAPPLVIDGVAYYPTWNGLLVALQYSGCRVLWQSNVTELGLQHGPISNLTSSLNQLRSRTTPALYKNTLFIGTLANALLLAIDRRNGTLIDTYQISTHPLAILTMSPTVWQGKVFIGSSSNEEYGAAIIPGYKCCSFIGAMNGLAFEHNRLKLLWSKPMVPIGSKFAGASVWGSQPSIDRRRNQVFVATGNVYAVPASYVACTNATANNTVTNFSNATDPCAPKDVYSETVLAFDTTTGMINWSHRLSPIDAWNAACIQGLPGGGVNPGNCPPNHGPDADFGMAPTFVPASKHTPSEEDTLVIGKKNGNLYGLAASDGALFWTTATPPEGTKGGLIWGIAADSSAAYYTAANTALSPWKLRNGTVSANGLFGAVALGDGKILWETPVPRNSSSLVQPTVVNDLVLVGSGGPPTGASSFDIPGSFIALDKFNGNIVTEVILDGYFQAGIAAVHDYVMFGTGYSATLTSNGSFNVWRLKE
ncbi:MAG: hypothetical protein Q9195_004145 [Heterodermia aff. obscurata]